MQARCCKGLQTLQKEVIRQNIIWYSRHGTTLKKVCPLFLQTSAWSPSNGKNLSEVAKTQPGTLLLNIPCSLASKKSVSSYSSSTASKLRASTACHISSIHPSIRTAVHYQRFASSLHPPPGAVPEYTHVAIQLTCSTASGHVPL